MTQFAKGATIRRDAGLYGFERALARQGLTPSPVSTRPAVARAPARWSPLPSCLIGPIPGIADSKLLTEARREKCFDLIMKRAADVSVVIISAAGLRPDGHARRQHRGAASRACTLAVRPGYVLTDGFPVDGLGVPGLAVWKGDRVAASIAAASIVAKVTRDRIMVQLHEHYPAYDFATHKGYCTSLHQERLDEHGPCAEHRRRYVNVRAAMEGAAHEL